VWLPETNIRGPQGEKGDQGLPGEGLVTFADTPPDKQHGSLWVESDTGLMYARYNDGTSEQWIAVSGATSGGPMGPVGEQGEQGETGPQGPQGPQGEASTVPGPQGPKGDTGPQGPLGPQGNTGPQGVKGDTGSQGPKGDQGVAGPVGPTGLTGPEGPIGLTGADSTVPGPVGPEGPQGEQGEIGPTGADSVVPGPQGPQGIQGVKGDTGAQGIQGVKGDTGAQGIQGVKGDKGDKGDQGIQGPQGVQGVPGEMTQANADLRYVNVTGDAMSGDLIIDKVDATLKFNAPASNNTNYSRIEFQVGNSKRWIISGAWGTQAAGNVGCDFSIDAYDNAGQLLSSPLYIARSNYAASFSGTLACAGTFRVNSSGPGAVINFGTLANTYLQFTGAGGYFNFAGGPLHIASTLYVDGGPGYMASNAGPGSGFWYGNATSATRFFVGCEGTTDVWRVYSQGGGSVMSVNGSNATVGFISTITTGGSVMCGANLHVTNGNSIYYETGYSIRTYWDGTYIHSSGHLYSDGVFYANNYFQSNTGYMSRDAAAGIFGGHIWNFCWKDSPTGLKCYIGGVDVGFVAGLSDYRIKKDVIDLPGMWDTVKALRPIKYTQAEFQPPAQKAYLAKEALRTRAEAEAHPSIEPRESDINTAPMFEANDIEQWGFIAHELQETLIPSAATGEKDSPDTVQSPNPWTVIATLTKALQEAMLRIETLEARIGV